MRRLLAGSAISAPDKSRRTQDAYSLRCIPQVHGAVRDVWASSRRLLEIEINSATDNPLIFAEDGARALRRQLPRRAAWPWPWTSWPSG